MAVTATYLGMDQVKGPYSGSPAASPLHLIRFTLNLAGTYATGGFQVDLANFFTGPATVAPLNGARMGVTALNVLWANAFGDYNDGTTTACVSNANSSLTSGGTATSISAASTNNLYNIKLYTGTNGSGGVEVTNATALGGAVSILVACQLTGYSSTLI